MEKKRIMALDVGEKRIGIAISDPTGTVVSPLMTYKRKDPDRDADFVVGLLREKGAELLLLGLPVLPSGKEGTQAAKVREFARKLEESGILGREVYHGYGHGAFEGPRHKRKKEKKGCFGSCPYS